MRGSIKSLDFNYSKMLSQACVITALLMGMKPAEAATPVSPPSTSIFGVQTHMLNTNTFFAGMSAYWNPTATLPLLKKLGGQWIRDGVCAYTASEHALVSAKNASPQILALIATHRKTINDYYSLYDAAGMHVIFTIIAIPPETTGSSDLNADFLSFVTQIVAAHPSIYAVELHNEPSSNLSWNGTPEEYVSTYHPFADAVHKARPDIKVLGGGGSGLWWSKDFYNRAFAAGMMNFIDGISVHPYNNGNVPPEVDVSYGSHGSYEDSMVAMWQQFQTYNTTHKKLELDYTELGYSSVPGSMDSVPTPAIQASYLSRLMMVYQDLRVNQIPLNSVEWYDFKADGNDTNLQDNFGLTNFDLSDVKPAFTAYKTIIGAFPVTADLIATNGISAVPDRNVTAVETKTWQRSSDGALIVPFWRLDQIKTVLVDFNGYLTVTFPDAGKVASVTSTSACGLKQNVAFSASGTSLKVSVTFSSCASWLTIVKK